MREIARANEMESERVRENERERNLEYSRVYLNLTVLPRRCVVGPPLPLCTALRKVSRFQ